MQKFSRASQMAERYGINNSTLWRWVQNQIIPPPIKPTTGTSLFDIEACDEAIRQRDQKPKRIRRSEAA